MSIEGKSPRGSFAARDLYAGALVALIGAFAIFQGRTYNIGSLGKMGPGFFPVMIGAVLIAVGLLISAGVEKNEGAGDDEALLKKPDWRGMACIVCSVVAFVVLAAFGGLIPAAFTSIFIAAMGDRTSSAKGALMLAAVVTLCGVLLFHFVLQVQMPLFMG